MTDWDRRCGFNEGDDVVSARRREDAAALSLLGATPLWLDFLDRQYAAGRSPDPAQVADALATALDGAPVVASPLGLGHPDHLAVAAACRDLARRSPGTRWFVYEDAIYRATAGGVDATLSRLRDDGFMLRELEPPPATAKQAAIAAYATQVVGLGVLLDDASRPERCWEISVR